MTYFLYRLGAWLLYYTHEAIGYPLFGLAGLAAYALNARARRQVAANMRVALGADADEATVQRFTREAFRNLAWNYYDLFHMPAFTQEKIRQRMDLQGLEHLRAAVERGKGVLLTSAHYGNTEVLMQIPLFFSFMQFTLLVEKLAEPRIYQLLSRLRKSQGMEILAVDEPLKILRRLKQGFVIGIAIDRDVTHSGDIVSFFGKPARLPDGAIRMAMRTGAAIVPAYGWRAQSGRFHIRILPPLELTRTDDVDADVQSNLRRLLAIFEQIIRKRPGQWMAFHKIFDC